MIGFPGTIQSSRLFPVIYLDHATHIASLSFARSEETVTVQFIVRGEAALPGGEVASVNRASRE
jgi:hypothetical protein